VKPELDHIKTFCQKQGVDQILMIPDGCNVDGSHFATIQGKPYTNCFWPWVSMVVDADGSVYTCGEGFDGRLPYGNVNKDSLESIWNNDVYTETRRFLSGKSVRRDGLRLPCYECGEHFGTRGTFQLSDDIPMFSRTPEQLRGLQPLRSPEAAER
jgi:radical SAM protein with 4Fe4S-binding SPASM domain